MFKDFICSNDEGKVTVFCDMNAPTTLKLNAQQSIMKNLDDMKRYLHMYYQSSVHEKDS